MFRLPTTLLALTFLSWANCLADMSAYVAMVKKGFGELAITTSMTGPVFNIMIGMGASTLLTVLEARNNSKSSLVTIRRLNGDFITNSINPLILICAQIVVLLLILLNGLFNNYHLTFVHSLLNLAIYIIVIVSLVVYSIII